MSVSRPQTVDILGFYCHLTSPTIGALEIMKRKNLRLYYTNKQADRMFLQMCPEKWAGKKNPQLIFSGFIIFDYFCPDIEHQRIWYVCVPASS